MVWVSVAMLYYIFVQYIYGLYVHPFIHFVLRFEHVCGKMHVMLETMNSI